MQIVSGYSEFSHIRKIQRWRLYHMNRPAVKKWRASRHGKIFELDQVDQWIIDCYKYHNITAVDFGGWYFNDLGIHTTVLEGDVLSRAYYPKSYVEFDLISHRPTYLDENHPVVFKNPWFLKYCEFENFVNFLKVWTRTCVILNFDPVYVQHNHLKFALRDLAQEATNLRIHSINQNLWTIQQ